MLNNLNTTLNYRQKTDLLWSSFLYNLEKNDFVFFNLLYNEIINYNLSLFKAKAPDNFLEIENKLYYYLIKYGEIFITFFDNTFQFWVIKQKFSKGINLEFLEVQLIQENLAKNYYPATKIVKFRNLKNGIYLKWEENIVPSFLKYYSYIKLQLDFFKVWKTAAFLDNKKFIYNVNNSSQSISKKEIESILDPEKTFILNIAPFSENNFEPGNLFKEINTGMSNSNQAFTNLENLRKLFSDIFGFSVDKNNKKERKNLIESVSENYISENVENIILKNLNVFARQAKKLWNLDIAFEKNIEIIKDNNLDIRDKNYADFK